MCGLVGIFDSKNTSAIDVKLLNKMNDTLSHRGPDGDGIFTAPGIGLGHRRLSIIDLSGGTQPMFDREGNIALVYNGEIYNYRELIKELSALGYEFQTKSDTEVVIQGWKEWGQDCVKHFRGMFAIALWDKRTDTLFLSRDRLGKKPLYYSHLENGTIVFGSELKSVTCHPEVPNAINPQAVEDYMTLGYVPDPKSIYKSVNKLPPAHNLCVRRGRPVEITRYWQLDMTPRIFGNAQDIGAELIERLDEAVRIRMISDVPLGAFLSGGVDSSAIVALMSANSSKPVNSYSVTVKDPAYDESSYAKAIAERYHTNHSAQEIDFESVELLDHLTDIYDEPFGDSSALPTYKISSHARSGVTVALSGDGGDEIMAGYRRYGLHSRFDAIRQMVPFWVRSPLFGMMGSLYPKMDWAPQFFRAKSSFQELSMPAADAYCSIVSALSEKKREHIFSKKFKAELSGYSARDSLLPYFDEVAHLDTLSQAQYVDICTYLPGKILVKVDRASMANSLEVRAPLLDHELVSWISSLDPNLKLNKGVGKFIFKNALEKLLPKDVLYRPKQGFSVPLAKWFRESLRHKVSQAVTGDLMMDCGYFNPDNLRTMVKQHQSGLSDHSEALWLLFVFESFLRKSCSA